MGTLRSKVPSSALFGKTRQAVLALLYSHDGESFYLRQIVREVGLGQGTVQRELAHLTETGLLHRARKGNQVYYQANRHSSIFPEIKSLIVKTAGIADVLRAALEEFSNRIQFAFLYGSFATGTEKAASDVDLVVIGNVTFAEIVRAVGSAQGKLRREINPSVYSPQEFHQKLLAGHHFLNSILVGPKIILMGSEDQLKKLGSRRLAHRA